MIRLVASGVPLPFAGIDNRRSLIFLGNLVDLAATVCLHPAAGGQVLLARDAADLSTPELIRALAAGLGGRPRLFAVPPTVFAALSRLPMLGPAVARLTSSLQVDDGETRRLLGWSPAVAAETGLAAAARGYGGSGRANAAGARGVYPAGKAERKMADGQAHRRHQADRHALAYAIELYRELTEENGAPTLGTQNQAVDFILADPELSAAVADWGETANLDEATIEPPRRLPCDATYRQVSGFLLSVMKQPEFCSEEVKSRLGAADIRAIWTARRSGVSGRRAHCRALTSFRGSTSPRSTMPSPA